MDERIKKYEAELLLAKSEAENEKKRFQFFSNAIPNLIWTMLPNGEVNFINQRVRDYFNDPELNELHHFKWVIDEDREKLLDAWQNCLATERKLEKEVRFQAKEKSPEWFLMHIEPYYKTDGTIETWLGSSTNIHKRKLLQLANYAALSDSLSSAYETIDDNMERFTRIATDQSHMIRKPLANILGLISILNDVVTKDEHKDIIKYLNNSSAELDCLIKAIVDDTTYNCQAKNYN